MSGQGFKGSDSVQEGQIDRPGRAVTLFTDDQFGYAFIGVVFGFVIDLVPVDEADKIGILLNGPGFPEVGELGTFVGTILQASVDIGPEETAAELHDRLAVAGAGLLKKTLHGLAAGTLPRTPQDHTAATPAPRLRKADGLVDWTRTAQEIHSRIRGFNPWPGSACRTAAGKRLKLWRVTEVAVTTFRQAFPGWQREHPAFHLPAHLQHRKP